MNEKTNHHTIEYYSPIKRKQKTTGTINNMDGFQNNYVKRNKPGQKFTNRIHLFVKIPNKFIVAESTSVVNWRQGGGWYMVGKGRKECLHCRIRRLLRC